MACFLVPTAEAIVVTVVAKAVRSKEIRSETLKTPSSGSPLETPEKLPFSRKLKWLANMLWGGAVLLAFEHVWHGELTPWFPFLTAAASPTDAAEMLREMATAGAGMAVLVTAVWACILAVTRGMEKRAARTPSSRPAEN